VTAVYLTASQVAERLQVSVSWVYKHKHLLGAVRFGERMWRFPEEWLRDLASQPQAGGRHTRPEAERGTGARRWRLTY
jgi:excisionase family DNA binding protein